MIPYSTDVVLTRWPYSNIAIIALCVVATVLRFTEVIPMSMFERLALDGWAPLGMIGHLFFQNGIGHLMMNMLYLWVFGNAVCETTGNTRFPILFLVLGLLSAAVHNLLDGDPAIGASGAINGVIGFYLILFPVNRVSCAYGYFGIVGTWQIKGYWIILLWVAFDLLGATMGWQHGIAYSAKVAGFIGGAIAGSLCEVKGWAQLQRYDNPSLIDLCLRREKRKQTVRGNETREELIHEYREFTEGAKRTEGAGDVLESITALCPYCNQSLEIPEDRLGATVTCPSCSGSIEVEVETSE